MRRFLVLLCSLAVLFLSASCVQQLEDPYQDFSQTARMTLRGGLQAYDAPATKAAAALVWNAGDKIFVRARAKGGDVVTGVAEYRNGEWSFSYRGNLVDFSGTVQCYYFQSDYTVNNYGVTLSYNTPIYEDAEATITSDGYNGVLMTTYLKPKMGRVCFGKNLDEGVTRTVARITGLSYYTSFDLNSFALTTSSSPVEQYVTSREKYFYGFFTDAESRTLTLRNAGIEYQRSFAEGVMQKGKSGYLDIPTYDAHANWEMLNYQQVETTDFTVNGVTFRMVSVPGGTFNMGDAAGEVYSYSVTLNNYLIGQTEVTQELWQAVMGTNPSSRLGADYLPVENVSWWDCQRFIYRLNALTGRQFRLPTEAEWEYAARGAGVENYAYSGSNTVQDVAWNSLNSDYVTHPVATLAPNSLGLFDMSGNVSEWCEDWYGYYPSGSYENPRGPKFAAGAKISRGGGYNDQCNDVENPAWVLSRTSRDWFDENSSLGLRLVLSSIAEPAPEPVDLGLSVKWGSQNLGAWCAEDGGDYFAWGEIYPKVLYNWSDYEWMTYGYSDWNGINKYSRPDGQTSGVWYNGDTFIGDNKKVLDLEDDPAWALLGAPWRMPTREEWEELFYNSSLSWVYPDNGDGFSISGPNGNSIFLPAFWGRTSGRGMGNFMSSAYYLSSSLGVSTDYAVGVEVYSGSYTIINSFERFWGASVRPVYDPAMLTALTVMPGTLDVGNVICGNSTQLEFKVRNNTKETVSFTIEDLPGAFSVSPSGAVTLGPGQSQQMVLTFAPTTAVQVDTKFRIASAALDAPLYVELKGTGVAAGEITTYSVNGVSFNMVSMPAGSFLMGRDGYTYGETPVHRVSLSAYQIGQTEVTQELWEAVMGNNPSNYTGDARLPVESVSWYDAQGFIHKLNALTGLRFRLPTEAEWEYAAREAGTSDALYSGSNELDDIAWFSGNSSSPQPVAQKNSNALGIYDMCGNVWEWCSGYFYEPYDERDSYNPRGKAYGGSPNHRGGAFNSWDDCRVTYRGSALGHDGRYSYVGFRLVVGGPDLSPEAVDLGLSVKWASFNIGAHRPSETGLFFAWGETESKVDYSFAQYKFMNPGKNDGSGINKYTVDDGVGNGFAWYDENNTFIGDGQTKLESSDDVAQVTWGGGWRMPTVEECAELVDNCDWVWVTQDGMDGMLVTGPSGASIFLPAAGYYFETNNNHISGVLGYPSSTVGSMTSHFKGIFGQFGERGLDEFWREEGFPVRPVCP